MCRTAWKRHRVNYSQLVELLPYLSLAIVMLMSTVEVFISNDLHDLFVTMNSGRSESVVMLTWSCSGIIRLSQIAMLGFIIIVV